MSEKDYHSADESSDTDGNSKPLGTFKRNVFSPIREKHSLRNQPPTMSNEEAATSQIAATAMQTPSFNPINPRAWFRHVEGLFHLHKITVASTKIGHLLKGFNAEQNDVVGHILDEVADWKDFTDDHYQRMKEELIKNYDKSPAERAILVLDTEPMGDRKPSQFYRHLQRLSGDLKIDEKILKMRWAQRLPTTVRNIVQASISEPIDKVLQMADNSYEGMLQEQVSEITRANTTKTSQNDNIANDNEDECAAIRNPRPQRRGRPQRKPENRKQFNTQQPYICHFHRKFGNKAYKCEGLCIFKPQGNSSQ